MKVWARRFAIAAAAALVASLATTSLLDATAADCVERADMGSGDHEFAAERDLAEHDATAGRGTGRNAAGDLAERIASRQRRPSSANQTAESPPDESGPSATPASTASNAAPSHADPTDAPAPTAADCARDVEQPGCRFLDPDPDQLTELARCGQVRFEVPAFLMSRDMTPEPDDAWLDAADLTDDERAAFAEVGELVREQLYAEVADLFVEAGRDRRWAEQTPFIGLVRALYELPGAEADAQAAIARVAPPRRKDRSRTRRGATPSPRRLGRLPHPDRFAVRRRELTPEQRSSDVVDLGSRITRLAPPDSVGSLSFGDLVAQATVLASALSLPISQ